MYSRTLVAIATATSLTLALTPAPQALAQEPVTATATASINTDTEPAEASPQTYADELAVWQERLASAEQTVAEVEAKLVEAQSAEDSQREQVDTALEDLEAAKTQHAQAKAELAKLDIAALEAAQQDAKNAVTEAERTLREANQSVSDARAAQDAADSELAEAVAKRDEQQQLVDDTEDALRKFAQERENATNALAETKRRDETGADYSQDDWKRLTAQAVEEMINQYRRAHGLHELVTHPVYRAQAEAWSRQMVWDYDTTGSKESFRHSDGETWGHSGENIMYNFVDDWQSDPSTWDRNSWHNMPYKLFDGWRESSGHNKNMLSPTSQGMAVGIEVAHDGRVYATTMFFIEDTRLKNGAFYSEDGMTTKAKASGEPFYLPHGAIEVMRAKRLTTPEYNPGEEPSYALVNTSGLDKSRGKSTALDSRVTPVDYDEEIKALNAYIALVDAYTEKSNELMPERQASLEQLIDAAASANQHATDTAARLRDAQDTAGRVEGVLSSERTALDDATAALENAKATPRGPFEQAVADANAAVKESTATVERQEEELAARQSARVDAQAALDQANAELKRVQSEKPTHPTKVATEEGSSTAGTAVAVIVALLTILAAGIALAPQLGIAIA